MEVNTPQNHQISFMKFIMSVIVLLNYFKQFDNAPVIFNSHQGSFAVEFFFIVSGYFMISSYEKALCKKYDDITMYRYLLVRKVGRLILPVLISWIFSFIIREFEYVYFNEGEFSFFSVINHLTMNIPELFCLHGTGIFSFSVVGITWYISFMLISMMIIFYILIKLKDSFIYAIAPIVGILLTSYCFMIKGYDEWPNNAGLLNVGMIRAVSGLCLGVLCYTITQKLSAINFTALGRVQITIIELFSYVLIFCGLYIKEYSFNTHLSLKLLLVPLVAVIMSEKSYVSCMFTSAFWDIFSTASLWLYLSHWRCVMIFSKIDMDFSHRAIYSAIFSFALAGIEYFVFRIINANKEKIKGLFIHTSQQINAND